MYRQKAIIFVVFLASCLLTTGTGYTATIPASSCSRADVQDAVDRASEGDTVTIPGGTCTWTSYIATSKNITIAGAGSDNTTINRSSGNFFRMSGNGAWRVTGIHFIAPCPDSNEYITAKGTGGWRVDHCHIENTASASGVGVEVRFNSAEGHPVGLIDNNTFTNLRVYVHSALYSSSYNMLMAEPSLLGTKDTVYIEDNVIDRTLSGGARNSVDSEAGGSYVFRFNTTINAHIEVHGSGSGSSPTRAGRYWEIYGNELLHPGDWWDRVMFLRGGTGIIFNNEVVGDWNGWGPKRIDFDIRSQREGSCNGSSPVDGNLGSGSNAGWPCRDNIGRATDEFQWVSSSNIPDQRSEPAYIWGNTNFNNTASVNGDGAYIVQNRDYYEDDDNHMGSGTWANRPGTCSEGDGYWATDRGEWNSDSAGNDGQLYKCDASNIWVLYYTPYTYPHPLRGGAPAPDPVGTLSAPLSLHLISLSEK